jgi:microcystin-dependent protein
MSEPFLAEVRIFGSTFAPRSWAFCDGQLLPISQNTALFSLVGTTYGGDGRTTFGLPDLRGRMPMHVGTGPGLSSRRLGERGGAEQVTLSVAQVPSHNHSLDTSVPVRVSSERANHGFGGGYLARSGDVPRYGAGAPDVELAADSAATGMALANSGEGRSHNNVSPALALNFIIALNGLFPSRP